MKKKQYSYIYVFVVVPDDVNVFGSTENAQ